MQSPFNPYMGMASRSPFYDMLATPLLGGDTNTNGLGTNAGPQNDSMFGGVTDQQAQSAFGSDFMGKNDPAFSTSPGLQGEMGANPANSKGTNPTPPGQVDPNGLAGPSAVNTGWGATVTNVAGVPVGQPAKSTPAAPAPMGLPAATVMNAPTQAVNNPSVGLNNPSDFGGQSDPQGPAGAGNPGNATSPDQDPTGGLGAGSTASSANTSANQGMAATGSATGIGSGEHNMGGGGGGGGDGGGGPGGPGPGDHGGGQGVGGTSGSENGQGHYAKGGRITHQSPFMVDPNPHNADDMPIEAQRDEHVVTVNASKGLGRKFLDTANKEFAKKGADRKAVLKKLAPLMGKD